MRYKATDKSIKVIGAELGVATILEGSIRREGDDIRVTVQLIKVEDESHLWAENYKKKLASVFALQDEVSQAIAQALQVTLTPAKISALASAPPKNTAAYEYYLKGKYQFTSKYVPSLQESDFQAAVNMFNKALKSDSNYALAYVGLAAAYEIKWAFNGFDQKVYELFKRNAEIAVALDPNLADAHALLADACINNPKPDFDRAYKSLKIALRLNPNLAEANQSAGLFLWYLGLTDHAIKWFYRNIELNPFWTLSYSLSAICLLQLGRLEEAAAQLQKLAEIEPDLGAGYEEGALLAIIRKEYAQADSVFARAERINPMRLAYYKAMLFAARGEKEKALALSQDNYEVYALLGMKDEAFRSLQRYREEHENESLYLYLRNFPLLTNLRDDPRFMALVKKEKKKYEENLRRYGDLGVE